MFIKLRFIIIIFLCGFKYDIKCQDDDSDDEPDDPNESMDFDDETGFVHNIIKEVVETKIAGPGEVRYSILSFNFRWPVGLTCVFPAISPKCNPLLLLSCCGYGYYNIGHWIVDFVTVNFFRTQSDCAGIIDHFKTGMAIRPSKDYKCGQVFMLKRMSMDSGEFDFTSYNAVVLDVFPKVASFAVIMFHQEDGALCRWYMSANFKDTNLIRDKYKIKNYFCSNFYVLPQVTRVAVQYMATCPTGSYDYKCWYLCTESPQHYCDETGNQICKSNYDKIFVRYKLNFKPYISMKAECLLLNPCKANQAVRICPLEQSDCIAIENNSYVCTKIRPHFISNMYNSIENMSSDMILVGERLLCHVGKDLDPMFYNSTYSWWTFGYWRLEYNNLVNMDEDKLESLVTSPIDISILVHCKIRVYFGYVTHTYKKLLIFAKAVENLEIINTSMGTGKSVYLNQILECKCDGWPTYTILYNWILMTDNFYFQPIFYHFGETLPQMHVPPSAELGMFIVNCTVFNIFDHHRPPMINEMIAYFTIKRYAYFEWEPKHKNVFFRGDYLSCVAEAFLEYTLEVYQIGGLYRLVTDNSSAVLLNVDIGGSYEFLCRFISNFNFMRIYHHITVFRYPDKVCFQMFPKSPGEIVHCSDNSYPKDMSTYTLYITDTSGKIIAFQNKKPFIQIPYQLEDYMLTFYCNITYQYQKYINHFEISETYQIYPKSHDIVGVNQEDIDCDLNAPYKFYELYFADYVENNIIKIDPESFVLIYNTRVFYVVELLIAMFSVFSGLLIVFGVYFLNMLLNDISTEYFNLLGSQRVRVRQLQEKLDFTTQVLCDDNMESRDFLQYLKMAENIQKSDPTYRKNSKVIFSTLAWVRARVKVDGYMKKFKKVQFDKHDLKRILDGSLAEEEQTRRQRIINRHKIWK